MIGAVLGEPLIDFLVLSRAERALHLLTARKGDRILPWIPLGRIEQAGVTPEVRGHDRLVLLVLLLEQGGGGVIIRKPPLLHQLLDAIDAVFRPTGVAKPLAAPADLFIDRT